MHIPPRSTQSLTRRPAFTHCSGAVPAHVALPVFTQVSRVCVQSSPLAVSGLGWLIVKTQMHSTRRGGPVARLGRPGLPASTSPWFFVKAHNRCRFCDCLSLSNATSAWVTPDRIPSPPRLVGCFALVHAFCSLLCQSELRKLSSFGSPASAPSRIFSKFHNSRAKIQGSRCELRRQEP